MAKTLEQKIDEGRQYRSMQFRALDSEKEDEKFVEGYASTFNDPYLMYECESYRYFEQVDAHAFDECDMDDVIFQYDHEGRVFARKSNGTLDVSTDEHGLKIRANLGGTAIGRELYEEIKGGYTNKMSFGFTILDKSEEKRTGADNKPEYLSTIKRVKKLYDCSAVSLPANDGTAISARKLAEGLAARDEAERVKNEAEEAERLEMEMREHKRAQALNI